MQGMIKMPRGSRKTIEERVSEIDLKINELNEQKKQLLEKKEQEDIQKLLEAVKEAGVSPAELVKKLTEKTPTAE